MPFRLLLKPLRPRHTNLVCPVCPVPALIIMSTNPAFLQPRYFPFFLVKVLSDQLDQYLATQVAVICHLSLIPKMCTNSFLLYIQAASKSVVEAGASKPELSSPFLSHPDSCFLLEGKPLSISLIISFLRFLSQRCPHSQSLCV